MEPADSNSRTLQLGSPLQPIIWSCQLLIRFRLIQNMIIILYLIMITLPTFFFNCLIDKTIFILFTLNPEQYNTKLNMQINNTVLDMRTYPVLQ